MDDALDAPALPPTTPAGPWTVRQVSEQYVQCAWAGRAQGHVEMEHAEGGGPVRGRGPNGPNPRQACVCGRRA